MSKYAQDFSNAHLRPQYKKIDGHIVEVGKIDLQELYNSLLPSSLDSILKAFLNPEQPVTSDECYEYNSYDSFEDLADMVNDYSEQNGCDDLSFSETLLKMLSKNESSSPVVPADVSEGGDDNEN